METGKFPFGFGLLGRGIKNWVKCKRSKRTIREGKLWAEEADRRDGRGLAAPEKE
jgi:hypothetical protein